MWPTVYLVAEDEPGLAVGRKLVAEAPPLIVYREENGRGFGRLKNKAPNYNDMGLHGFPVLMLTDLDRYHCPPALIDDWLGITPSEGFLFRICVREVEAWILAHRDAIARFLGVSMSLIPLAPETLPDPKAKLIELAQRSQRRAIRTGFKPVGSSTIGPDYNRLLGNFIVEFWDASTAALAAPSLARARGRVGQLASRVNE